MTDKHTPEQVDESRPTIQHTPVDPKVQALALLVAECANQKKAKDVVVQDVGDLSSVTDYYVIATGVNARQVSAIVDEAVKQVRRATGRRPLHRDGVESGTWAVLDLGEVIFHVFQPADREHYRLEGLWNDAPIVDLAAAGLEGLEYSDRVKGVIEKAPVEKPLQKVEPIPED